jgi:hypothetical protein
VVAVTVPDYNHITANDSDSNHQIILQELNTITTTLIVDGQTVSCEFQLFQRDSIDPVICPDGAVKHI